MSFGKWLVERREKLRLTQPELAKRAGVSTSYISALERDEPNAKDGSPRRPRIEKVDRIAKALQVPVSEARHEAGYATTAPSKPQTLAELLERLEAVGIENLHFADHDALRDATPEDLQGVLDAVTLAIEVTLNRQRRNNAPTEKKPELRK